jgi:multidrug efflux pump subunit AcrB
VGRALAELKADLRQLGLPAGYELDYGGKSRLMEDLAETALAILGLAVFLAIVVLAVQFNSVRYPLLILCCLPVSAAGMVFALWGSELALGATVLVGLLVVVAATVNDGVLLFTLADELRAGAADCSADDAVREAARVRLRPRVMTTATTIAGLLPLALNVGAGGDMLQPMAVGAIGGLLLEIPVALFLMPCLYVMAAPGIMKS